ncbi:helix-turn-helix transcriptional regulator [Streptomyces sp. SID11385]|uniref:helix-turn-helix domain-containing protein n=1 Tax=Streptomyces sp. SID11385 TaxID=2706031 RepID=UPI0013C6EA56|nr:helix-turn-helix transcriptional regulator [Streptomyces sp. SID11385]NEA40924.1 helix-turn-helix transcriptional regulator [Streptomyces sp. SID11385]
MAQELADLVRKQRKALKLSMEDVAERALDPESGTTVSVGWIGKLERGEPTRAPSKEVLKALQSVLGVPLRDLQEAASAQYFGYRVEWSTDSSVRVLAAKIGELGLTRQDRQELAEIAEMFARRRARHQD